MSQLHSMRLIKLYRLWNDIMQFKLKAIKESNSVYVYCSGGNDFEIYNKIIEIEKTLK